jgi:hypothetical protein
VLARLFVAFACLAALALGVSACGDEEPGVDEPAREGLALELDGVAYNVFITRQLNPAVPPDDAYVEAPEAEPSDTLYGIFLQTCNTSDEPRGTAEEFVIVDAQGNEFEPDELPLNNRFAYHPRELLPQECIPEAGSVAQLGPTAGSMLLFTLPLENTEYRPLELEINGGGAEGGLTFELDI